MLLVCQSFSQKIATVWSENLRAGTVFILILSRLLKRGPQSGDTETGKVEVISKITHFIEDLTTQISPAERTEADRQPTHR